MTSLKQVIIQVSKSFISLFSPQEKHQNDKTSIIFFFLGGGQSSRKGKEAIGAQTGNRHTGPVRVGAGPLFVHVHMEILIGDWCVSGCKWADREGSCALGAGSEGLRGE